MNRIRKRILDFAVAVACVTTMCAVQASAADTKLPILMYHNLSTESSDVNSMTITADRFRQDMEFLEEYGFTPLLSADLINIKSGAQPMPQKPVMITFDDGYESNYTLAYPIIKETGMKATVSVITSHIRDEMGSGFKSSMTWEQVKELYDSGIIDIGSHSHAMHNELNNGMEYRGEPNGVQRMKNETYSEYQSRMMLDLSTSVSKIKQYLGADKQVWYFSYPFGATDSWFGQTLLDNGFYVSTTTITRTANIANGLYGLPRYRIMMDKSVSQLLQQTVWAKPVMSTVALNGSLTALPTYQINGSNFVKLRDVAAILNGTKNEFSVSWLGNDIKLKSGETYQKDGTELRALGNAGKTGQSMTGCVEINGQKMMLAAYNIDGNYYFKLRSLGEKLGFTVAFDEANQIVIIKTA